VTTPITDEKTEQLTLLTPVAPARTEDAPFALAQTAPTKPKRTLGLRLFDNFLYTFFTNTSVFLVSLGFTYMTKHGKTVGAENSILRNVGTWFAERREPIMNGLKKLGIKSEQAREDFTTVIFSFVDGTLFSFLVKPLEDRREKIARKIDDALGTTPENLKAYEAEPKQSWRSVIEGRALTSAIVLPVAFAMEKTGGNKAIFYRAGDKMANFVKTSLPKLDVWLGKKTIHHKNYFFQTGVFEAFYTSVCTIGLYFISRAVATKHPKVEKNYPANIAKHPVATNIDAPDEAVATQTNAHPPTKITQPTHLSRLTQPSQTAELTA